MSTLGFTFGGLGPLELGIILVLGLLLFGRRLPEVGRSVGKSIVEFKRGMRDIGDEFEKESGRPARSLPEDRPQMETPVTGEGEDARVSRADAVE